MILRIRSYQLSLLALGLMASPIGSSLFAQSAPPAPKDSLWHLDYSTESQGANIRQARAFLSKHPRLRVSPIVVGVIDCGLDSTLTYIKPSLWKNPKEVIDGKDNDKNGYTDDLYGWNFLGNADGSLKLTSVGTEAYREFKRLYPKYKNATEAQEGTNKEFHYYLNMRREAGIDKYLRSYHGVTRQQLAFNQLDSIFRLHHIPLDSLKIGQLESLQIDLPEGSSTAKLVETASNTLLPLLLKADAKTPWSEIGASLQEKLRTMHERLDGIEHKVDQRTLVGDNLLDPSDIYYGNNHLGGQGADHGDFVAGIIAAPQGSIGNVEGVYPKSKLMILRVVPDRGDEYDKDVSSAIRYAVDNGARILNLSLGKYISPQREMVEDAMRYAAQKDVLLIQSSGNDGRFLDETPIFPSGQDSLGNLLPNYIRIGATGRSGKRSSFSNYGTSVELYAPGEEIRNIAATEDAPEGKVLSQEGTSFSAPIVSGVAALLRAYFPRLKASQIKDILIRTARPRSESKPNEGGGIVDALEAVKLAYRMNSRR